MGPKQLTREMRALFYVASILVLIIGIPLFLLSDQTQIFFAWTIKSSLTAAFLGGSYWSAFVLEFLSARERLWVNARPAVHAVFCFTALTLVVTLVHLDKFHLNAPLFITVAGTWMWLGVYAVVPMIMVVLWVLQSRSPGAAPARNAPLPMWMRGIGALNTAVLLVLGLLLLLLADSMQPLWPWALTALTARAIGAWLIGLGVATGQVVWDNDLRRARAVMTSAIAFGVLQFIALARYGNEINWGAANAWLYAAFLVDFLVVGVYGAMRAWAIRDALQAQ
ncbi:MAG: hypothetical protein WCF84_04900 [Anaerolineae bacterium]